MTEESNNNRREKIYCVLCNTVIDIMGWCACDAGGA